MGSSNPVPSAVKKATTRVKDALSAGWSPIDGALDSTGRAIVANDPTGTAKILDAGARDLNGSLRADDSRRAINYGVGTVAALTGNSALLAAQIAYDTGTRIRDDQRDQAAGMAEKEQNKADAAEARAVNASVKDVDPLAMERRRRATLATNKGSSATNLTAGRGLGSADVSYKTLLGL